MYGIYWVYIKYLALSKVAWCLHNKKRLIPLKGWILSSKVAVFLSGLPVRYLLVSVSTTALQQLNSCWDTEPLVLRSLILDFFFSVEKFENVFIETQTQIQYNDLSCGLWIQATLGNKSGSTVNSVPQSKGLTLCTYWLIHFTRREIIHKNNLWLSSSMWHTLTIHLIVIFCQSVIN